MTDGEGAPEPTGGGRAETDGDTDADRSAATLADPESVDDVLDGLGDDGLAGYNYAYLDEHTKREVRRAVLKAIAVPGHQVPFASRAMPLARGWGTGGIQASLSLLGPEDRFKVIDQGSDESVNAANIRRLAERTADVETTTDTTEASIVQTRHRIPEEAMTDDQILVLQVPVTDPLRRVDGSDDANRRRHAHANYSKMWVALYENVVEYGEIKLSSRYPVLVADRYLMDPSPIPRWDVPKLDDADHLSVFAAGREARIYAVPPNTDVEPLAFEDRQFRVERFPAACEHCGSTDTFLTEVEGEDGQRRYACNDTSFCAKRAENPDLPKDHHRADDGVAWGPPTDPAVPHEAPDQAATAGPEETATDDATVDDDPDADDTTATDGGEDA